MNPAPTAPPAKLTRFTIDGSAELEAHLLRVCERVGRMIAATIPARKLEAILLGGGYGRGEGGVLRADDGDHLYNDLEYYVGVHGHPRLNEQLYGRPLHRLAELLSGEIGIEVEFKLFSLGRLQRDPVTMFSYDLVSGHRWILGDENLLADCTHHAEATHIPLAEATRLLLNRCTGLLFARERLQRRPFTDDDADFTARNLAKARLAFGDVVLAAHGKYHWSCRERLRRLALFPADEAPLWLETVRQHHAAGVDFKLHPTLASATQRDALTAQLEALVELGQSVWLWLETRRLDRPFSSVLDYALSQANKCPDTSAWRNRLAHARAFGLRRVLSPRASRYPRERLLQTLPLLLWAPHQVPRPRVLNRLQRDLRCSASNLRAFISAYQALWAQFR